MNSLFILAIALFLLIILPSARSGNRDSSKYLGKLKLRHAKEIQSSLISVGAEMMDRDYTIYKNWKDYLGPLGAKKARIQSGWAKCEKVQGVYDWAWLDEIVFDMANQGVEPWVYMCYGNSVYSGGGGFMLQNGSKPT